tara:strand:- start:127 stop:405 length:279 start_codon:yes stop_codon:yes gene_type:complete
MAKVIITMKLMPTSPDVDLGTVESQVKDKIVAFAGETETRFSQEPIAFGLKALQVIFVADEARGSTDNLEQELRNLEEVESVEVTDVRRAIG